MKRLMIWVVRMYKDRAKCLTIKRFRYNRQAGLLGPQKHQLVGDRSPQSPKTRSLRFAAAHRACLLLLDITPMQVDTTKDETYGKTEVTER